MAQEPYRTLADDEVAEKDRVSYADVGAGKASVFSSIANLCNAILGVRFGNRETVCAEMYALGIADALFSALSMRSTLFVV